jgi:O-Antigen ligase
MNNNTPAILRTLIIYVVCVPLAIWLGYILKDPLDRTTFISVGMLALLLVLPILMRWHHLLLILCWNLNMTIFFLKGNPTVAFPMIFMSFVLALLQRALSREMRFIPVPQITWPLLFMAAVVFVTGELTGGFGLRSFGGEVMGGKRYALIFIAIMGYFALTSQRIPPRKAWLYVVLFFLPGCLSVLGDLVDYLPSSFDFIFLFFPVNVGMVDQGPDDAGMRFGGVSHLAGTFLYIVLASYGLRGIFLSGSLWRPVIFFLCLFISLAGGYRLVLIGSLLLFGLMFFMEGLHRTKLLPVFTLGGILLLVISVPLASKLPYGFQRTLSFLPISVSAEAKQDADATVDWRIQIWKAVLPQVPGYLLLGKGYALSQRDFTDMTGRFQNVDAADWGAAIAGDYHNGPLSVIIPFGIWGAIAFIWLVIAGGRVLYNNYRYGDPALRTINTLFLASFLTETIIFFFIFGGLTNDMLSYAGLFGLSISLNGGMCRRPATAPVKVPDQAITALRARPGFQPVYPR